jgi:uncharacterized membrane protein YhaH (DUF805 family)
VNSGCLFRLTDPCPCDPGTLLGLLEILHVQLWLSCRRLYECYRESWLLLCQSIVFYVFISTIDFFKLDRVFQRLKPELQWLISSATGIVSRPD